MLHLLLAVLNECVKRPGVTEVLLVRHNLPHTAQRPLRGDNEYVTSTRKEKEVKWKVQSLYALLFFVPDANMHCEARHTSPKSRSIQKKTES